MPENVKLPNPQTEESDRDTRVRVKRNFSYAFGGVNVVRFAKDQVADVSEKCAETCVDDGSVERVDAEKVALFDPRIAVAKAAAKRK